MERRPHRAREGWQRIVESQGLTYAVDRTHGVQDTPTRPYWDESAVYVFTEQEIDHLDEVTGRLHGMCLQALDRMANDPSVLASFHLPPAVGDLLRRSIAEPGFAQDSLYGRFDLVWDGSGPPKLLEYNADTPTGLVEASVVQWHWLEDQYPDRDQWNLVHERLVQTWRRMAPRIPGGVVHLALGEKEPEEDWATVAYLEDTVTEAGLVPFGITMERIGWDLERLAFVDEHDRQITTCYKLYPWDWMLAESFGQHILDGTATTRWIEPVWKMLLGSKALLSTLWEMFPGHENLLPAYLGNPSGLSSYVVKPMFGWEGAGIEVVLPSGRHVQAPGTTQGQALVYQQYVEVPDFDGHRPVLGTWVVGGRPAGLGIRESVGPVTDTHAQFVPHLIDMPRSSEEDVARWLAG